MSYDPESIAKYKEEKRSKPYPEKPSTKSKRKKHKDYKWSVIPTWKARFTYSYDFVKLEDAEHERDKLNRSWGRLDRVWAIVPYGEYDVQRDN